MGESVAPIRLQGVLEKRGKFTGVFLTRKCHCMLENGHLTYRKDGEKEKGLDIVHVQYIRPGKDCSFEIVTRSSVHIFVAGSVSERDDWVRALRESMRTTSVKLPPSSTKFLPPRSNSEDSSALYETIPDSPNFTTRFPRSQTLSASARNKQQKWLSVAPYDTVSGSDPLDIVPSLDLPPKISKEGEGVASPVAACDLTEERKCLVIYEGEVEGVSYQSDLPVSDAPSADTPSAESDLYAYAYADDVRKLVLEEKPKICCEYSTVHDSRGSELLYSEVGTWDRAEERASSESIKAVCGLATVVEVTDEFKPGGGGGVGIYELAKDPDAVMIGNDSRLPGGVYNSDVKLSGNALINVFPRSMGLSETPKVSASMSNSKMVVDRNAVESSNNQHKAARTNSLVTPKDFSVLYRKVEKPHSVLSPSKSFPSHPLIDNSTVLGSSDLCTQVVKPCPNFCSKMANQLSNDSSSVSHSPASLALTSLTGNSTTVHTSSISDAFDVYTKVVKPAASDSTLSKLAEGSSFPEIPRLPCPRISSKYQSPFDEIRTVIGETREDGEEESRAVTKGANAVDDLRLFLQQLEN